MSRLAAGFAAFGIGGSFAVPAQTLPPNLTACAAQADPGKRLACYDAAVARVATPKQQADATPVKPSKSSERSAQVTSNTGGHIQRLESHPDAMVVYLDNGQVWQQVEQTTGDPALQMGDSVTIEKSFGSYWLSGRSGIAVKVRQKN